ncbi:MAG: phage shock protein PspA [Spirochaetia bacterium]|nr:phage shock protein PspA [Spirochaetia bacterium]
MGVFTRFKDIVNANINSMLDKAENPEKMIRLMMQEMEDTLIDLKSSCAAKMAGKAKAERELREIESRVSRWQNRAELALSKQREDLAREALIEKKKAEKESEGLADDILQYSKLIEECKANIIQLEEKLQSVRQKHKILVQRSVHAQEQKKTRETISQANGEASFKRFSELEGRIERMEAEASMADFGASGTVEDEFSKLETSDDIEDELNQLKDRLYTKK